MGEMGRVGEGRVAVARAGVFALFVICLLLGGWVSVWLGPDMNWDLQNYHLYNPFAFLNNRLGRDFMAADIQSYLNPLLDVPFYLAWTKWFHQQPRVTAFLAGLPYGAAIFLTLQVAWRMLPGEGLWRGVGVLAATAIGVTGTVTISEVGTSFNDIAIAVLMLCALFVELRAVDARPIPRLISGAIVGVACGLKLTAVIFAPGMVIAIMLTRSNVRLAIVSAILFCLGWACGLAISSGWWGWEIYQQFGNPIFPMFNGVFGSPWYVNVGRDLRFMPHGVLQAIFYPFYWMNAQRYVSEVPMSDPRFACTYVSVVVLMLGLFFSRASGVLAVPQRQRAILLLTFVIVSFLVWEVMFSIARYMLVLELLSGVIVAMALYLMCESLLRVAIAQKLACVLLVATTAIMTIAGLRMDWGRMQYDRVPDLVDSRIVLPNGATMLVVGRPVTFILPFVQSENSTFIGIDTPLMKLPSDSPARRFIDEHLAASKGNTWVLTNQQSDAVDSIIGYWKLVVREQGCRDMTQSPQMHVRICPVDAKPVGAPGQ